MKKQGLKALQPKRFVPKTTKSHPNLRACWGFEFKQDRLPNQIFRVAKFTSNIILRIASIISKSTNN